MSALAKRLLRAFVSPAAEPSGLPARTPEQDAVEVADVRGGLPPSAAVLGACGSSLPMACGLAGALRRQAGSRTAVVGHWQPDPDGEPVPLPAVPAARRLEARLQARGLRAAARGRLVVIELDPDPAAAMREWRRVTGMLEAPSVLAVDGPRPLELDAAVWEATRVLLVVAAAGDRAAGLLASLAADTLPAEAAATAPPLGGLARRRALAGWASCDPPTEESSR